MIYLFVFEIAVLLMLYKFSNKNIKFILIFDLVMYVESFIKILFNKLKGIDINRLVM